MQHQQQRGSFSGNRFHFRLQVKLKFSLRALISYKVDLLLKICNTHTQSVLHATVNEWQQTKASQQNLSRRDHDCVARGGFLFAASQLQHCPSPAPACAPQPPLHASQFVRANGPQCYPHATVESRVESAVPQPGLSQSQTKVWQTFVILRRSPPTRVVHNI